MKSLREIDVPTLLKAAEMFIHHASTNEIRDAVNTELKKLSITKLFHHRTFPEIANSHYQDFRQKFLLQQKYPDLALGLHHSAEVTNYMVLWSNHQK